MNLSIHHYRCFLWVAETGSFRAAAELAYRSQPAISLAIREMEAQLGQPLFERGQPVTLTPFGKSCHQGIRHFVMHADALNARLGDLADSRVGQLNIASIMSFATHWMPTLVSIFRENFPHVHLNVFDGNSEEMERMLLSGQIELAVGSRVSEDRRIEMQPLLEDAFGLVCHADHPLAQRKSLTWRQISDLPIIGTVAHRQLERSPQTAFLRNRPFFVSNMISLIAMLSRDMGVTVLARLGVPPDTDSLAFVPLTHPRLKRTLGILKLADATLSPAAEQMRQLILDTVTPSA